MPDPDRAPADELHALLGGEAMPDFPVAPERAWAGTAGLRLFADDDGALRAELPVTDAVRQPGGLVHGGIYSCVAEELASVATVRAVAPDRFALGMSNLTHFHRPVTAGSVHAVAEPIHRGRTTWVWTVTMSDDEGRRCATSTVTMAVRERPR